MFVDYSKAEIKNIKALTYKELILTKQILKYCVINMKIEIRERMKVTI
jgi:hypothetical protein